MLTADASGSGDLFESFLVDSWDTLGQFEEALGAATATFDADALGRLAMLAHRIKGTTALYGYPQMSRLAELAERLLELRGSFGPAQREGVTAFLERLVVCMRSALERVSNREGEGELGLEFAQLGGTVLLRTLLTSDPSAFRRRQGGVGTSGAATAAVDLTQEVRAFRRDNDEVWSYFAPEAREHIESMRALLDVRGPDAEALTTLFRSAHTLKGSSYMVGFTPLGDLGHVMEDVMSAAREGRLSFDSSLTQVLGEGVDAAERLLLTAEGTESGDLGRVVRHTKRKLLALLGHEDDGQDAPSAAPEPATPAPAAPAAQQAVVRVTTARLDALMGLVGEVVVGRSRLNYQLQQLSDFGRLLQASHERMNRTVREFEQKYLDPAFAGGLNLSRAPVAAATGTAASSSATVREMFDELEFDSYGDLNIVARAISEMSADLSELQGQFEEQVSTLLGESDALGKLARSLRFEVARARRVPFSQALTRLKRWARTRGEGEVFTLDLSGETVEVDTFVLEGIVDPLLHLANNALVHGLETPEAREANGKSRVGRIMVRAEQKGAFLEVSVRDDGAGIDLAAVRERAARLMPEDELARVSDHDAAALIFLPGLSTAREVTQEAGRGVGMDVVASNVRRLGGEVLVDSRRGLGTTFTLRVPLTQQITETLLMRVGSTLAGLPTASVRALRQIEQTEVRHDDGGATVEVDGETLRLLDLRELWDAARPDEREAAARGELLFVVAEVSGRRVALGVDAFEGIEDVTVRAPGPVLANLPYLAGTTSASSGEVVLLLDAGGVDALTGASAGTVRLAHTSAPRAARPARLLLVDDSLSVRRVVTRMLERAGYDVVTAADGEFALDVLRVDSDFDAVLTDLEMPRVSGYELIEEVRRRADTAHLPVVVMTTRAGDKHQQLAYDLGATAYFSKPIDEQDLIRRLQDLTRGTRHLA